MSKAATRKSKARTSIAKDSKTVARKTKTASDKKTVARPRSTMYPHDAKIVILEKGKANPRREGGGPYQRYAVILKSKTVGEFLNELPKWSATLRRAEKEGLIEIKK